MLTTRLVASAGPKVLRHYLALPRDDRCLRFGGALADASIETYVRQIDFDADAVFGVLDGEEELAGVAHLPIAMGRAELGVSVLPRFRRCGIGTALVSRGANHARAAGIAELSVYCLAENAPMLRIARSLGMRVMRSGMSAKGVLVLDRASVFPAENAVICP